MASIKLTGDTSGEITISAPAVAGTNTLTLPANTGTVLSNGGDVDLSGNNMYSLQGNIGSDAGDYITFTTDTQMDVYVNGSNEFRFEADGDFHADGDVIAFSTTISDVALKTDIELIPNALDKIDQVRGVTFTRHNGQKSAGIIAQELEKVLPEAVREKTLALVDGKTYKTVEYDAIHGLLINCIKELKEQIKELKDGITK